MQDYIINTFYTVKNIDHNYWSDLQCTNNVYFSPEFLWAYEKSNPDVTFRYIVVTNNKNKAISLANIQIIKIGIDTILKNIKITKGLKKTIDFFLCKNELRIMFCGNVFLSGEHGIFIKDGLNKQKIFESLVKGVRALIKQTSPLDAIFVKDFYQESRSIMDDLIDYGYSAMPVEPNMILTLDPAWKCYNDYKSALKSKYRIKVNKADKTSINLTSKRFTESDFSKYKIQLQQLYQNTIDNADFNAQILNLDTYIELRRIFKENFIVVAYFKEDQLVGFLSALKTNNHLDAHFIGLDYKLNKPYAIYPRILNDYIRIGIDYQVSQINFGRTASEIKSTIGAHPEQLMCYIRHKNRAINGLLKPFFGMVKIKDFKKHKAFKTKKEA